MMTPEELRQLRLFNEQAAHLKSHSLLKDRQLKVKTVLKHSEENGYSERRHHIDFERLESLILRLRIFYQEKEECNFHRNRHTYAKIAELRKVFGEDVQDIFVNGIINMVQAVMYLDSIVKKIINSETSNQS